MKKKAILFFVICTFSFTMLHAQVGINITNVQGVFHIDPMGDTNGANNTSDDILINNKGYIGIGTIAPEKHLHIDKGSAASFIRIEDTSEGSGTEKYLFSDAQGRGSWKDVPNLSGKVYRMISPNKRVISLGLNYDNPILFNKVKHDTGDIEDNIGGYIEIPSDGNYVFTVRWWGVVNITKAPSSINYEKYTTANAYIKIRKVIGGDIQSTDSASMLISANVTYPYNRLTFITSLFMSDLKKDDVYVVCVRPTDSYTWSLGASLAPDQYENVIYFPSVMVYNI